MALVPAYLNLGICKLLGHKWDSEQQIKFTLSSSHTAMKDWLQDFDGPLTDRERKCTRCGTSYTVSDIVVIE